jgi:hypothetical protein
MSTYEGQIDVLAIHSIRHTPMSWNAVSKILNIESALEARSEKATKWCNQRSEARHEQQMELIWRIRNCVNVARELRELLFFKLRKFEFIKAVDARQLRGTLRRVPR